MIAIRASSYFWVRASLVQMASITASRSWSVHSRHLSFINLRKSGWHNARHFLRYNAVDSITQPIPSLLAHRAPPMTATAPRESRPRNCILNEQLNYHVRPEQLPPHITSQTPTRYRPKQKLVIRIWTSRSLKICDMYFTFPVTNKSTNSYTVSPKPGFSLYSWWFTLE